MKRKVIRTVTDKNGSSMRPGLEELVLEIDLGDLFNVGHVKQVSHGAIGGLEVADLVQHLLVVLVSPV